VGAAKEGIGRWRKRGGERRFKEVKVKEGVTSV